MTDIRIRKLLDNLASASSIQVGRSSEGGVEVKVGGKPYTDLFYGDYITMAAIIGENPMKYRSLDRFMEVAENLLKN
tara:strand:+ start:3000 stop:3230 length:231 start_codon:yes stop_codon:yes gene_type:complete